MYQNIKYLVGASEKFKSENYPLVNVEVTVINEKTFNAPLFYKDEIIISFLKDHSLHYDWIHANPELAELVTSGEMFTGSIESLFEASRNNLDFREDFEQYLAERFATS
jgi:hypothetical protein